jgi:hypothetical protein
MCVLGIAYAHMYQLVVMQVPSCKQASLGALGGSLVLLLARAACDQGILSNDLLLRLCNAVQVDMEGKRADWEGVVLVPFVDEVRPVMFPGRRAL